MEGNHEEVEGAVGGSGQPSEQWRSKQQKHSSKKEMAAVVSPRGKSKHQKRKQNPFDRKMQPKFENYGSKEDVELGLKQGKLIKGVLRINQKNYEEAFVDDPVGGSDYFIAGVCNRNRALAEDIVVIQVLPRDKWLKEQNAKLLQACASTASQPATESSVEDVSRLVKDISKLSLTEQSSQNRSDCESEVKSSVPPQTSQNSLDTPTLIDALFKAPTRKDDAHGMCTGNSASNESFQYRRTAKVVYIMNKVHSRIFAGHLKAFNKEKGLALVSPRDTKAPRVLVPLKDCPKDYPKSPGKYDSCLFICQIEDWSECSPFPTGNLIRSLGKAGEIEGESEAILLENSIDFTDFSREITDSLPQLPWLIPKEEEEKRRDFRKECVFTIDPDTARDLDDALHVKQLREGVYEVGVHIADVSYFIEPGSALDREASRRATSVYLVQKVIPMLPRVLCEHLCSLNPDEDKLTFSVVWQLNMKGELISQWIGRSMIHSCVKLSYSHAQLMIDGKWQDHLDTFPPISGGYTAFKVADAISVLNKVGLKGGMSGVKKYGIIKPSQLAGTLRAQRQSKGTLKLDQPKLSFVINSSTGLPCGCEVYPIRESNRLIEEFMLLANMTVARVTSEAFPESTMLRRHPKPKEKAATLLVSRCASLGISLDISSAAALQASLDHYKGFSNDDSCTRLEKMILVSLCSRIMNLACYFASHSGEVPSHHYALNVPLYTHFTSPIRRYADIVVHRQLAHAIGEGPTYNASTEEIASQASLCNQKKKSAKIAGDSSIELFFAVFLKECGPLHGRGMVMQVLDKSFDVLMEEFGIIKRVYCDRLPLEQYKYEEKGEVKMPHLTLLWSDSKLEQVIKVFTIVEITLQAGSKSLLQYEAKINPCSNLN